MTTVTFDIPSIHCMHCVHTIKMELMEIDGVKLVEGDAESKKVSITFDLPADENKIRTLLGEINYPVEK
jgi:copper chaperone